MSVETKRTARWPWLLSLVVVGGAGALGLAWLRAREASREGEAIARLIAIYRAQERYREEDRDGDGVLTYAESEAALVAAGLLPAWSEPAPYRFEVALGEHPQFTWMACAAPTDEGARGDRCFAVSYLGELAASPQPILPPPSCERPSPRMELFLAPEAP